MAKGKDENIHMGEKSIASAGLVYFYLCGNVSDEGSVYLEPVDSYRCLANGFYEKIKGSFSETRDEDDVIHIMGVIGTSDKVEIIGEAVKRGLQDNAKRIIHGKNT